VSQLRVTLNLVEIRACAASVSVCGRPPLQAALAVSRPAGSTSGQSVPPVRVRQWPPRPEAGPDGVPGAAPALAPGVIPQNLGVLAAAAAVNGVIMLDAGPAAAHFSVQYTVADGRRVRSAAAALPEQVVYADTFTGALADGVLTCSLCASKVKLRKGRFNNFKAHLASQHAGELTRADADMPSLVGAKRPAPSSGDGLRAFFRAAEPLRTVRDGRFGGYLAIFVSMAALSFASLDSSAFKFFASILEPGTKLPSTFVVGRLHDVATALRQHLRGSICKALGVAVPAAPATLALLSATMDAWTSPTMAPFMLLTLHYIDASWALVRRTAACTPFLPPHTAAAIAECLTSMTAAVGLLPAHMLAMTTDKGSNMLAGMSLTSIINFRCCAHGLHNAVTDAFKTPAGGAHHGQAARVFVAICPCHVAACGAAEQDGPPSRHCGADPLELRLPRAEANERHWDHLSNWPADKMGYTSAADVAYFTQLKAACHSIMPTVRALLPALQAVEEVTNRLSASASVTISIIPSCMKGLLARLDAQVDDTPTAREFRYTLRTNIQKRYEEVMGYRPSLTHVPNLEKRGIVINIATLLDPTTAVPLINDAAKGDLNVYWQERRSSRKCRQRAPEAQASLHQLAQPGRSWTSSTGRRRSEASTSTSPTGS
jgi:hypothetical protein